MRVFSPEWFDRYQAILLWFANSLIGRWVLRIHGKRSSVGKHRIIRIQPNHITWISGITENLQYELSSEFRTHNKFSKRLFYGLYPLWWLFHQWDMLIANPFMPEWNLGFDTLTVYPDPHVETTTVDGMVGGGDYNTSWAAVRGHAGNSAYESNAYLAISCGISASDGTNKWMSINRSIYLFNTSALGASASISSAVMSLFAHWSKADVASWSEAYNIYSSAPASNTALANGDFDSLGTTKFSDTNITATAWTASAWNSWTFNASGIGAISKTGVSKFGLREAVYDAPNSAPPWSYASCSVGTYYADSAGTTYDPKLVVTYTASSNAPIPVFMSQYSQRRA